MSNFEAAANDRIREDKSYWTNQSHRQGTPVGPRGIVCYICGRPFGSESIKIHQPVCLKKFELENANLPPNQRRKLVEPNRPDRSYEGMSVDEREKFNELAFSSYGKNMIPCHCGRTFATAAKLQTHQKLCTVDNPIKRHVSRDRNNTASIENAPESFPIVPKKTNRSRVRDSNSEHGLNDSGISPHKQHEITVPLIRNYDKSSRITKNLVKCPHCNRNFDESTSERHILICQQDTQHRTISSSKVNCYECGAMYPSDMSKFCDQCGYPRCIK